MPGGIFQTYTDVPVRFRLWPARFLLSPQICMCVGPHCGARHEALNEGFLSAVGGFTQRGVELDTGG